MPNRQKISAPAFALGKKASAGLAAFANFLLLIAIVLLLAALCLGCSLHDVQYPFGAPREPAETPSETVINIGEPREKMSAANAANLAKLPSEFASADSYRDKVINIEPPVIVPSPKIIDAPEMANINRYARALEEKLLQRYNNTPRYAGNIGKVQVLPVGDPQVSLRGDKLKVEWSQVVFDIWGERVPELEKEFYVVTFGDGKPVMQRTRPTITVGLNNEGGYGEYKRVRGGIFSERETTGNPAMFARPDSERNLLLDDQLNEKHSAPDASDFYDLPEIYAVSPAARGGETARLPVIKPAPENLTALIAND